MLPKTPFKEKLSVILSNPGAIVSKYDIQPSLSVLPLYNLRAEDREELWIKKSM
jgi:hypothetical protein